MGVSKVQAIENRQTIVETAARVFREVGVDGVGVADLMRAAGFTHGGFYNHFESKNALAAEACAVSFEETVKVVRAYAESRKPGAFRTYLARYFSLSHRDDVGTGCPSNTLVVDAARQRGELQDAYATGIGDMLEALESYFETEKPAKKDPTYARRSAMAVLTNWIGTLTVARALSESDPKLSLEFIKTGKDRLPA